MPDLPDGTVTFLLTDVERSTAHWAEGRSLSPEYAVTYALEQPGQPRSDG